MSNLVTASIHFCFKGISHGPSITLELNEYLESAGCIPDLYPLIAKANNHDLYSYEYEMMQAEKIVFSDAKGPVAEFITDGELDMQAFERAWKERSLFEQLTVIAKTALSIDDLDQQPDIKKALLEAYRLGAESCKVLP